MADKNFCTDNAAMIGVVAESRVLDAGVGEDGDGDIRPHWSLDNQI
jgi:tRNA A37 threonylcarbamoyltransferase TsaD